MTQNTLLLMLQNAEEHFLKLTQIYSAIFFFQNGFIWNWTSDDTNEAYDKFDWEFPLMQEPNNKCKNILDLNKGNIKKIWELLKQAIGTYKHKTNVPHSLSICKSVADNLTITL